MFQKFQGIIGWILELLSPPLILISSVAYPSQGTLLQYLISIFLPTVFVSSLHTVWYFIRNVMIDVYGSRRSFAEEFPQSDILDVVKSRGILNISTEIVLIHRSFFLSM
ncbi:hypothetical protein AVEN_137836-1 [Araneus ventricosus]|uniref:Uncharacterized protein n=1 Tax=Araneus ventricosus TaxID=182803 RepID=A0A4Y2TW78_ARAVE|nr:hypothetical protein AVEN_137836-1 [Araneus ventricosus]